MKKNIASIFFLAAFSYLLISCNDDNSVDPEIETGPQESKITFELNAFPDIGSTESQFEFSPKNISDTTFLSSLKFRYDFDGDGKYESDWMDTSRVTHQYSAAGKQTVKIELKDDVGNLRTIEYPVYVGLLEKIPGFNPLSFVNEPSFAKDGSNRIVYNTSADDHQLFIVDVETKISKQLTFNDGSGENTCHHIPDWSPDGEKIAVLHKGGLYIVDVLSGEKEKISDLYPFYIEYSPDGKTLIVISSFTKKGTYFYNLQTGEETLFSDRNNGVTWSSDGKQIAEFDRINKVIKLFDIQTKQEVKSFSTLNLRHLGERDYFMDWSTDGKWIYICHYNALLNVESGKFYTIKSGKFKRERLAESAMNKEATMIAFTNSKEEDLRDPIYILRLPSEINE